MELGREERLRLMPDSFVCPVVHIDKERFPVSPQCVIIHCVAVILGGDKTLLRPHHCLLYTSDAADE